MYFIFGNLLRHEDGKLQQILGVNVVALVNLLSLLTWSIAARSSLNLVIFRNETVCSTLISPMIIDKALKNVRF